MKKYGGDNVFLCRFTEDLIAKDSWRPPPDVTYKLASLDFAFHSLIVPPPKTSLRSHCVAFMLLRYSSFQNRQLSICLCLPSSPASSNIARYLALFPSLISPTIFPAKADREHSVTTVNISIDTFFHWIYHWGIFYGKQNVFAKMNAEWLVTSLILSQKISLNRSLQFFRNLILKPVVL